MTKSDAMNEATVIVVRKPDNKGHVSCGEAYRLIGPLLETNGLAVGEVVEMADGFLFPIRPRTDAWDDTERNAVATGLASLGPLGYTGYIAQKLSGDGVEIDGGTVALGLAAVAAVTVFTVGGILVGVRGVRAIGRCLCARRG